MKLNCNLIFLIIFILFYLRNKKFFAFLNFFYAFNFAFFYWFLNFKIKLNSYTGVSESLEGSIAISYWEDEGATGPVFYFFKDSVKEIKC